MMITIFTSRVARAAEGSWLCRKNRSQTMASSHGQVIDKNAAPRDFVQ